MEMDPIAEFMVSEPEPQQVEEPILHEAPAPAVEPEPVIAPVVEEKEEEKPAPEPFAEPVEEPEKEAEEKPEPTPKPTPADEAKPKATPKPKPTPKAKTPKAAAAPAAEGEGRAKRERKTVQHFEVAKPKEEEPIMMEGKGTKLRDIPNVAFKMSKISGRDELMESLHNIMYRRKGAATTRKKAILDFNGFAFAAENEEKEIEARKTSLGKWKLDLINKLMDTLDISRGSGDKGTKIDRVVEFLQKPEQKSDVDLAAKEAAKKEKEKRKRERAAAQKAKKDKAKKKKASAPASKKKAAKEETSGSESESEVEESEEESASESEEEVMPTKKKAKTTPSAKKEKKATPISAAAAKKASTPTAEEEEQPVMKLSLDKIKADVEGLLSKMSDDELGMLTVKSLLAKMQEIYGFEVRPRKSDFKAVMHAYAEVRLPQEPVEAPAAEPEAAAPMDVAEPDAAAEEAA